MYKPRILIAAYADEHKNEVYIRAVREAGGEPVCRYAPAVDISFDGLLLCGGEDISPVHYGEQPGQAGQPDEARDTAELALARAYIEYGKPVFGICRGAQLLNVALGGSLWQHIRYAEAHAVTGGDLAHPVQAEESSLLWDLYDRDFRVNSSHHQAVRLPGCGINPTAWAADGTIEGFEHERLPLFGVQWHPERILHGEGGCAPGLPLFRYFLCLCTEAGNDLHAPVQRDPDVRFACGILDEE
jgi:putative glutamine amidotransferase